MNNEQILKRAINKAINQGLTWGKGDISLYLEYDKYYAIIFQHDFAKSFWGEGYICSECMQPRYSVIAWKGHLQNMVLEPEPIKYLEKFI